MEETVLACASACLRSAVRGFTIDDSLGFSELLE